MPVLYGQDIAQRLNANRQQEYQTKLEREQRDRSERTNLLGPLLGAGLGYMTGGLSGALLGGISGLNATEAEGTKGVAQAGLQGWQLGKGIGDEDKHKKALSGYLKKIGKDIQLADLSPKLQEEAMSAIFKQAYPTETETDKLLKIARAEATKQNAQTYSSKKNISLGNLSDPGSAFFSAMQNAIENKTISYEDAVNATLQANTVPVKEKPILIKAYKRFGGL